MVSDKCLPVKFSKVLGKGYSLHELEEVSLVLDVAVGGSGLRPVVRVDLLFPRGGQASPAACSSRGPALTCPADPAGPCGADPTGRQGRGSPKATCHGTCLVQGREGRGREEGACPGSFCPRGGGPQSPLAGGGSVGRGVGGTPSSVLSL